MKLVCSLFVTFLLTTQAWGSFLRIGDQVIFDRPERALQANACADKVCNGVAGGCDSLVQEFIIPSTHNSNAHSFESCLPSFVPCPTYHSSQTNNTIAQQLTDGIRGFDLDVCVHGDGGSPRECHGADFTLDDRRVDVTLNSMLDFMNQNPCQYYIIRMSNSESDVSTNAFMTALEAHGLAAKIWNAAITETTTVGEIARSSKPAVFLFHDDFRSVNPHDDFPEHKSVSTWEISAGPTQESLLAQQETYWKGTGKDVTPADTLIVWAAHISTEPVPSPVVETAMTVNEYGFLMEQLLAKTSRPYIGNFQPSANMLSVDAYYVHDISVVRVSHRVNTELRASSRSPIYLFKDQAFKGDAEIVSKKTYVDMLIDDGTTSKSDWSGLVKSVYISPNMAITAFSVTGNDANAVIECFHGGPGGTWMDIPADQRNWKSMTIEEDAAGDGSDGCVKRITTTTSTTTAATTKPVVRTTTSASDGSSIFLSPLLLVACLFVSIQRH